MWRSRPAQLRPPVGGAWPSYGGDGSARRSRPNFTEPHTTRLSSGRHRGGGRRGDLLPVEGTTSPRPIYFVSTQAGHAAARAAAARDGAASLALEPAPPLTCLRRRAATLACRHAPGRGARSRARRQHDNYLRASTPPDGDGPHRSAGREGEEGAARGLARPALFVHQAPRTHVAVPGREPGGCDGRISPDCSSSHMRDLCGYGRRRTGGTP